MSDSVTPWIPSPASLLPSLSHSPLCSLLPQPSPHFIWGWGVCMFFSCFQGSDSTSGLSWVSSVQSLSRVRLFATPWTTARQASLSITSSRSLLKPMSLESVMPSNHLILSRPLLLLPSVFPSVRVFSSESLLSGLPVDRRAEFVLRPAGSERFRAAGVWPSGTVLPVMAVFYNVFKARKLQV